MDDDDIWKVVLLLLCVLLIVASIAVIKIDAFVSLIVASIVYGVSAGVGTTRTLEVVNEGLGNTVGSVGVVIIFGTIIGGLLDKSNGAVALARVVLRVSGQQNVTVAMALIGFVVGIPVFADSGFILLSPLSHALSYSANTSRAAADTALSFGLSVAHTMIPPTPGPLAAAGILGADLGLTIAYGFMASIFALGPSCIWALHMGPKCDEHIRRQIRAGTVQEPAPSGSSGPSSPNPYARPYVPRAILCFLPIIVPLVLIGLHSAAGVDSRPFGEDALYDAIIFLGDPTIALFIGVLLGLLLPERFEMSLLSSKGLTGDAIRDASTILVLTGAGGAFSEVLTEAGTGDVIGEALAETDLGMLIPILVAAGLKTATGSSTVALITGAGIMQPLMEPLGFTSSSDIALVVVAIGAGSVIIGHINSSFFWVIVNFSGWTATQGLKLHGIGTLIEGIAAGTLVIIMSYSIIAGIAVLGACCVAAALAVCCASCSRRPVKRTPSVSGSFGSIGGVDEADPLLSPASPGRF